jgi:hypothetical protein
MVNQQLLDFVKQSLAQGVTKEKINSDLIANGWTPTDINECFLSLNTPPQIVTPIQPIQAQPVQPVQPVQQPIQTQSIQTSQPVKPIQQPIQQKSTTLSASQPVTKEPTSLAAKIFSILIILLFLGTFAAVYYFRNELITIPVIKDFIVNNNIKIGGFTEDLIDKAKIEEVKPVPEQKEVLPKDIEVPVQVEINPEQNSVVTAEETKNPAVVAVAPIATKTGVIDCGKDMACFTDAIKTCSPSTVEQSQALNLLGMYTQTNKAKITLTGFNSFKKCGYISQVMDSIVGYSAETIASPNYKNATDEEKKQGSTQLTAFNDSVKNTIGLTTKCSFTTTYLTEIYKKWIKGEYSSKDLDPGNCEYSGGDKSLYTTEIGLYYNNGLGSTSNSGYEFKLISINENQIELKITKESTKETKNITLVPKQEVKLFEATFSLKEIKKNDVGLMAWIGILKDNAKLNTF